MFLLFIIYFLFYINMFLCADYDHFTDYDVNSCLRVDNEKKTKYFAIDDNGFPYCNIYTNGVTKCDPNEIISSCEPGMKCGKFKKCEVDTASCFKYFANFNGNNKKITDLLWAPDCLEDGTWAAKQCKGGTAGRCFCYNAHGTRIFGDAFQENSANMTCACSRRKADLLDSSNSNQRPYATFHCDDQGNYEELQCDSAHCWCVNSKTGALLSKIVPEKAMQYLECSKKLQGSQYLRKCESQAYAQARIIEEMKKHGTTSANIQKIACGDDGSYGPYTIHNSQAICVTRNNAKMSYQTTISNIASMDCHCAYDEDLYSRIGKAFSLMCDQKGTYKPFQNILEDNVVKYFCVDNDGNKKLDNIVSPDPDHGDSFCEQYYD